MKDWILDIHTHTIASGHAYGTIREMAFEAGQRGIRLLGLTEHAPGTPGTCDPLYFRNLKVVPKELYGVKIVHGCEINVLNGGRLSLDEEYFKYISYGIVGIHMICYENAGIKKNTENLIACMKHPKVHFVSHPDDDHTPLDYDELVPAAREYGVALEVNNSSLVKKEKRLNCCENYRKMLELCTQYGTQVFIGSDAHDPSWVGEFSLARELISSVGFDEELIINNDIGKFEQLTGLRV